MTGSMKNIYSIDNYLFHGQEYVFHNEIITENILL